MTSRLRSVRVTGVLVAMAVSTAAWMFSAPPETAAALAPTQTAWWNVGNQAGAPALPPPPDVDTSKHDMYVQGAGGTGTPAPPAPPPTGNAQGGAQALAAIHYEVPDGAAVHKLTLKFAGNKPPNPPSVVACPLVTPGFKSEDNGPVSDIPKYDCTISVPGTPSAAGDALEFPDVGKLVRGPDLLLMLVPSQLDRVVFAHPDASALQVSSGYSAPATGAQAPAYSGAATDYSNTSSAGSAGSAGSTGTYNPPALAITPIGEPPLPAPLPTSAPAGGVARRALPTARPATVATTRLPLSAQQTRLVVGAATLVSIAGFAAMFVMGPRMTGSGAGSMLAPDDGVRGIGRFARPRSGITPRIW